MEFPGRQFGFFLHYFVQKFAINVQLWKWYLNGFFWKLHRGLMDMCLIYDWSVIKITISTHSIWNKIMQNYLFHQIMSKQDLKIQHLWSYDQIMLNFCLLIKLDKGMKQSRIIKTFCTCFCVNWNNHFNHFLPQTVKIR